MPSHTQKSEIPVAESTIHFLCGRGLLNDVSVTA